MPPQAVALRAKLDDARALGIITAALERNAEGKGGPYTHELHAIVDARVVGKAIEYDLPGPDVLRGDAAPEGCTLWPDGPVEPDGQLLAPGLPSRVATKCSELVALEKVSRIGVTQEEGGGLAEPGYLVFVKESTTRNLFISLSTTELPEVLAALTFYAPKARLTEGSGF